MYKYDGPEGNSEQKLMSKDVCMCEANLWISFNVSAVAISWKELQISLF